MMTMYLPKISCRSKKKKNSSSAQLNGSFNLAFSDFGLILGGVRHGVNLTRLREKNCRIPDKGATGLQKAGFAIGMRSNRIENSIRFGAWSTETFGRFGRVFRFNFSISSPVIVRNRRIEPKFGLLNLSTVDICPCRVVCRVHTRLTIASRIDASCTSTASLFALETSCPVLHFVEAQVHSTSK